MLPQFVALFTTLSHFDQDKQDDAEGSDLEIEVGLIGLFFLTLLQPLSSEEALAERMWGCLYSIKIQLNKYSQGKVSLSLFCPALLLILLFYDFCGGLTLIISLSLSFFFLIPLVSSPRKIVQKRIGNTLIVSSPL